MRGRVWKVVCLQGGISLEWLLRVGQCGVGARKIGCLAGHCDVGEIEESVCMRVCGLQKSHQGGCILCRGWLGGGRGVVLRPGEWLEEKLLGEGEQGVVGSGLGVGGVSMRGKK